MSRMDMDEMRILEMARCRLARDKFEDYLDEYTPRDSEDCDIIEETRADLDEIEATLGKDTSPDVMKEIREELTRFMGNLRE